MSKRIITIGRQFGSNGRHLGIALAKRLGINCYDRELIELAAQKMDIPFDQLSLVDEKREKPWSYQADVDAALDRRYRYEHIDEQLFHVQSEVIQQLARQESCIIVGRCADYVLKDSDSLLSVYFYAPYELRLKTVMERYDLDEKKAEKLMNKVDKDRSYYYNYYTDQYWEDMESYHLCLDTSAFSEEDLLDLLEHAYRQLELE
ncbi:AAA family ATPase [Suipraeoptans intestinalis]|uniref:Cytidylate kinase-like family protein n=1 Tax=Suipraeoptans intestinalis TaxID=2606628 RepID=A0A6N7UZN9_9FIRM|nr:cytidylate kinase-like family protein [Suipraeoptans intestinalis]MDD7770146.1 cytidylate kinase-like family protein [Suipraeoptans intestinalis]MDY3122297.1 cytidylate kinase-like family protein [Suipraeoptans intestinalis]MSR93056.1 cytidylate kinase-like family protein [Suipraeoptans intestinalis]